MSVYRAFIHSNHLGSPKSLEEFSLRAEEQQCAVCMKTGTFTCVITGEALREESLRDLSSPFKYVVIFRSGNALSSLFFYILESHLLSIVYLAG